MSFNAQSILTAVVFLWHGLEGSALYFLVTMFLKIFGIVVILDVLFLFYLHDVQSTLQKHRFGARRPLISPARFLKRWEAIMARTESGNPSYYKAAILEADALADEMLGEIGYKGGDVGDRLGRILPDQLLSSERLQEAHKIRNRIIHEPDFVLPKEEAEKFLAFYESFFKELELL